MYKLFLSDFSVAGKEFAKPEGFNNFYFLNETTRTASNAKDIKFENEEQRLKAEIYQIAVIFLEILLTQSEVQKILSDPETSKQLQLRKESVDTMVNNL